MSVNTVQEIFEEQTGMQDESGTNVSRVWRVTTTVATDGPLIALAASGIPGIGDDHPDSTSGLSLWVVNKTPTMEGDDGTVWKVKVDYKRKPANQNAPISNAKPWDLSAQIHYDFMARQRVLEFCYLSSANKTDVIGEDVDRMTPLVKVDNSIGAPFDPPAMEEDSLLIISITRNIRSYRFQAMDLMTYQNSLNQFQITVCDIDIPALQGWMRKMCASKHWTSEDEAYWTETIEIVINPETWLRAIVDRGYATGATVGDFTQWTPILDSTGAAIRDPVELDGAGAQNPKAAPPVYIYFHSLWETSWSSLGLPSGN